MSLQHPNNLETLEPVEDMGTLEKLLKEQNASQLSVHPWRAPTPDGPHEYNHRPIPGTGLVPLIKKPPSASRDSPLPDTAPERGPKREKQGQEAPSGKHQRCASLCDERQHSSTNSEGVPVRMPAKFSSLDVHTGSPRSVPSGQGSSLRNSKSCCRLAPSWGLRGSLGPSTARTHHDAKNEAQGSHVQGFNTQERTSLSSIVAAKETAKIHDTDAGSLAEIEQLLQRVRQASMTLEEDGFPVVGGLSERHRAAKLLEHGAPGARCVGPPVGPHGKYSYPLKRSPYGSLKGFYRQNRRNCKMIWKQPQQFQLPKAAGLPYDPALTETALLPSKNKGAVQQEPFQLGQQRKQGTPNARLPCSSLQYWRAGSNSRFQTIRAPLLRQQQGCQQQPQKIHHRLQQEQHQQQKQPGKAPLSMLHSLGRDLRLFSKGEECEGTHTIELQHQQRQLSQEGDGDNVNPGNDKEPPASLMSEVSLGEEMRSAADLLLLSSSSAPATPAAAFTPTNSMPSNAATPVEALSVGLPKAEPSRALVAAQEAASTTGKILPAAMAFAAEPVESVSPEVHERQQPQQLQQSQPPQYQQQQPLQKDAGGAERKFPDRLLPPSSDKDSNTKVAVDVSISADEEPLQTSIEAVSPPKNIEFPAITLVETSPSPWTTDRIRSEAFKDPKEVKCQSTSATHCMDDLRLQLSCLQQEILSMWYQRDTAGYKQQHQQLQQMRRSHRGGPNKLQQVGSSLDKHRGLSLASGEHLSPSVFAAPIVADAESSAYSRGSSWETGAPTHKRGSQSLSAGEMIAKILSEDASRSKLQMQRQQHLTAFLLPYGQGHTAERARLRLHRKVEVEQDSPHQQQRGSSMISLSSKEALESPVGLQGAAQQLQQLQEQLQRGRSQNVVGQGSPHSFDCPQAAEVHALKDATEPLEIDRRDQEKPNIVSSFQGLDESQSKISKSRDQIHIKDDALPLSCTVPPSFGWEADNLKTEVFKQTVQPRKCGSSPEEMSLADALLLIDSLVTLTQQQRHQQQQKHQDQQTKSMRSSDGKGDTCHSEGSALTLADRGITDKSVLAEDSRVAMADDSSDRRQQHRQNSDLCEANLATNEAFKKTANLEGTETLVLPVFLDTRSKEKWPHGFTESPINHQREPVSSPNGPWSRGESSLLSSASSEVLDSRDPKRLNASKPAKCITSSQEAGAAHLYWGSLELCRSCSKRHSSPMAPPVATCEAVPDHSWRSHLCDDHTGNLSASTGSVQPNVGMDLPEKESPSLTSCSGAPPPQISYKKSAVLTGLTLEGFALSEGSNKRLEKATTRTQGTGCTCDEKCSQLVKAKMAIRALMKDDLEPTGSLSLCADGNTGERLPSMQKRRERMLRRQMQEASPLSGFEAAVAAAEAVSAASREWRASLAGPQKSSLHSDLGGFGLQKGWFTALWGGAEDAALLQPHRREQQRLSEKVPKFLGFEAIHCIHNVLKRGQSLDLEAQTLRNPSGSSGSLNSRKEKSEHALPHEASPSAASLGSAKPQRSTKNAHILSGSSGSSGTGSSECGAPSIDGHISQSQRSPAPISGGSSSVRSGNNRVSSSSGSSSRSSSKSNIIDEEASAKGVSSFAAQAAPVIPNDISQVAESAADLEVARWCNGKEFFSEVLLNGPPNSTDSWGFPRRLADQERQNVSKAIEHDTSAGSACESEQGKSTSSSRSNGTSLNRGSRSGSTSVPPERHEALKQIQKARGSPDSRCSYSSGPCSVSSSHSTFSSSESESSNSNDRASSRGSDGVQKTRNRSIRDTDNSSEESDAATASQTIVRLQQGQALQPLEHAQRHQGRQVQHTAMPDESRKCSLHAGMAAPTAPSRSRCESSVLPSRFAGHCNSACRRGGFDRASSSRSLLSHSQLLKAEAGVRRRLRRFTVRGKTHAECMQHFGRRMGLEPFRPVFCVEISKHKRCITSLNAAEKSQDVCLSQHGPLTVEACVLSALRQRGWASNRDINSLFFDFKWRLKATERDYRDLRPQQLLNHFEGNEALTNKGGLTHTLQQLRVSDGIFTEAFYPRAYDLSVLSDCIAFLLDCCRCEALRVLLLYLRHTLSASAAAASAANVGGEQRNSKLETSKFEGSSSKQEVRRPASGSAAATFPVSSLLYSREALLLPWLSLEILECWLPELNPEAFLDCEGPRHSDSLPPSHVETFVEYSWLFRRNEHLFAAHWKAPTHKQQQEMQKAWVDVLPLHGPRELGEQSRCPPCSAVQSILRRIRALWPLWPQDVGNHPYVEYLLGLLPQHRQQKQQGEPDDEGWQQRNIWIVKPCSNARASGIKLFTSPLEILRSGRGLRDRIAQRYIERPLLLWGQRKFDLRVWVLVKSFSPLEVYQYSEVYIRLCTEPYDPDDLTNRFRHISNWSVNRFKARGGSCSPHHRTAGCVKASALQKASDSTGWEQDTANAADPAAVGSAAPSLSGEHSAGKTTLPLESLRSALAAATGKEDYWEKEVLPQLRYLVLQTVRASRQFVVQRNTCFELFGFDVLLDSSFRPWLLEVNLSPACSSREPWLRCLLKRMTAQLLEIVLRRDPGGPSFEVNAQAGVSSSTHTMQEDANRSQSDSVGRTCTVGDNGFWELLFDERLPADEAARTLPMMIDPSFRLQKYPPEVRPDETTAFRNIIEDLYQGGGAAAVSASRRSRASCIQSLFVNGQRIKLSNGRFVPATVAALLRHHRHKRSETARGHTHTERRLETADFRN